MKKLKTSLKFLGALVLLASSGQIAQSGSRSVAATNQTSTNALAPANVTRVTIEAQVQDLLNSYFSPKLSSLKKSINVVPKLNSLIFNDAMKSNRYETTMNVVRSHPGMETSEGVELLVFMQTVWEQRFGAEIRANSRDPRWGREGLMYSGTILSTVSGLRYFKGKIGLVADIGRRLLPFIGIGVTHQLSGVAYNPKRANGIPPSPFEILGFGDDRPEDHRWDSRDQLAWNLVEVASAAGALGVGKAVTSNVIGRFIERKNCLEGAEMILAQYSYKKDATKILSDFKDAGYKSLLAVGNWMSRKKLAADAAKGSWKEAFTLSPQEMAGFKNYWTDYIKSWGPASLIGAIAAGISVQVALDETSDQMSNQVLRQEIERSHARLEQFKGEGRNQELAIEAYRFRSLIEHYSDSMMIEICERSEEQLYHALMGSKGAAPSAMELAKINEAIRKTYSKKDWKIFETRIVAFLDAGQEYPEMMIPGLYREVSSDGLPDDPGNALLYGAAILHKNGSKLEFEKVFEKIANVYNSYKANRIGNNEEEASHDKE